MFAETMLVKASPMAAPLPRLAGERDLRLDLFRGMALWLIFLDHIPENIVNWFTIRNYGFSDATEIFIFISGYTAAFVYGRAMRERGFMVASARILRRAWQIYVAHVFLFTIFMAEIAYVAASFDNPLYAEEMNILDFLKQPDVTIVQALLLKFKPVNMDVLPLYIVLLLLLPADAVAVAAAARLRAGAARSLLYVLTWNFDLDLPAYPNGVWFFNPFAWQLLFVFGAWCALGGAQRLSRHAALARSCSGIAIAYLLFAFCHHADLVYRAARALRAGLARATGCIRSTRPISTCCALRIFWRWRRSPCASCRATGRRLKSPYPAAGHPLRAAFAGDLLPRRVSGLCRAIHHQRMVGRPADSDRYQPVRHPDHDCDSEPDIVVQAHGRARSRRAG